MEKMSKREKLNRKDLKKLSKNDLERMVLEMQAESEAKDEKIDYLTEQVRLLTSKRYYKSSEVSSDQMLFDLTFNEAETTAEKQEQEDKKNPEDTTKITVQGYTRTLKKKGKLDEAIKKMGFEVVDLKVADEELENLFPGGYYELPYETTHTIEHIPAKTYAVEYRIHKYRAKDNAANIVSAERPQKLFQGSFASASLTAGIINAKYVNAVPLYRIEQEFNRQDIPISRQDMANWIILSAERYLSLIYDQIKKGLLSHHVIHADETPTLVTKDGRKPGTKSYMWVYRSNFYDDKAAVIYEYQKTRHSDHPVEFLRDYKGIVVTDGFEGYHKLERELKGQITVSGCWVHYLRKWKDAIKAMGKSGAGTTAGTLAGKAISDIQKIVHEDNKLNNLDADTRLEARKSTITALVDAHFDWIKEHQYDVTRGSAAGKAINYALNQETYLKVFLTDGDVPMDNNTAERAIRPFCLGKKNWVMHDTIHGAKDSAIIYSITETAKANNLKPYDYIKYLLTEIPKYVDGTDLSFLNDLLPWSESLPESCRKKQNENESN